MRLVFAAAGAVLVTLWVLAARVTSLAADEGPELQGGQRLLAAAAHRAQVPSGPDHHHMMH